MLNQDEVIEVIKEIWEDVPSVLGGEPTTQVCTTGWPWKWRTRLEERRQLRFEEEDQTAHNED